MSDTRPNAAERIRPRLLAIARRMLGRTADAEDAVQEAYARYHRHAPEVAAPAAWLVRTTARLCLDHLRRCRPGSDAEPLAERPAPAAPDPLELADALALAFRVLLGTLSPVERSAFVLREAFGYEFEEIGDLLGKSPANARQIVHRAKRRLADPDRPSARPVEAVTLADTFLAACRVGDLPAVERLLRTGPTCLATANFLLAA